MTGEVRKISTLNIAYDLHAFELARGYAVETHQLLAQRTHPAPRDAAAEVVRQNEAAIFTLDPESPESPIVTELTRLRRAVIGTVAVGQAAEVVGVDQGSVANAISYLTSVSGTIVAAFEELDAELAQSTIAAFVTPTMTDPEG